MSGGNDEPKLHIVMFPYLAFGHMIPFLELAKFLAQKGHKISYLSTPRNLRRLPKPPPTLSSLITFVPLSLPTVDHLPPTAEATMDVQTTHIQYLTKAIDGLEPELTQFLTNCSPDWIIYDFAHHWLPPIAGKLGISRAFFMIVNAWFGAFLGPAAALIEKSAGLPPEPEKLTAPPDWVPFETNVAYRLFEAKQMQEEWAENASFRYRSVVSGCDVYAIRHCREFEPQWLTLLEKLHGKPVIPVGLMPPTVESRGDPDNDTWVSISEWLNKQNSGSVVYVALGSMVTPSQDELTELALGLELSGVPFFWVVRMPTGLTESDSVKLPDGFKERTQDRGIVWESWAPQLRILGHKSIGVFLTHCGWSSIIEGLGFEKPLVMLPFLTDQGLNARVMEGKKVGIEIPRDEQNGSFTRNSVAESIRLVVVDNEQGKIYREKARELSAVFGDKVLHDQYLDDFVHYLEKHGRQGLIRGNLLVQDQ